jgi:hypothetical protein
MTLDEWRTAVREQASRLREKLTSLARHTGEMVPGLIYGATAGLAVLPLAALAAYERAVALQPDFAMWRRNQADTLIELGCLAEECTVINAAQALEPDAPRLADLAAKLMAAQTKAG